MTRIRPPSQSVGKTTTAPAKLRGLARIIQATRYSLAGLRAALHGEAAFRQEVAMAAVLTPLAFLIGHGAVEVILLVGSLLLVLVVEMLNSAIESVVDRIGLEPHELSGRAKDMGSAAVMLSLACMGLVWGLILFSPRP